VFFSVFEFFNKIFLTNKNRKLQKETPPQSFNTCPFSEINPAARGNQSRVWVYEERILDFSLNQAGFRLCLPYWLGHLGQVLL
jgi:hypothetical protein